MSKCSVSSCDKQVLCKGLCSSHYQKQRLYGTTDGNPRKPQGYIDDHGYKMLRIGGRKVREHVHVVEKVLGKRLPKGPVIHHVNEVKTDNSHENLVVCQNEAYHQLLHRRARAYDACGDANARQCIFCKGWSPPEQIKVNTANSASYHSACRNAGRRKKYSQKVKA